MIVVFVELSTVPIHLIINNQLAQDKSVQYISTP